MDGLDTEQLKKKLINYFSPKNMELVKRWSVPGLIWTMAWGVTGLYFCEWEAVLKYLPFYSGKYEDERNRKLM
jgi:hypothetical protein